MQKNDAINWTLEHVKKEAELDVNWQFYRHVVRHVALQHCCDKSAVSCTDPS